MRRIGPVLARRAASKFTYDEFPSSRGARVTVDWFRVTARRFTAGHLLAKNRLAEIREAAPGYPPAAKRGAKGKPSEDPG